MNYAKAFVTNLILILCIFEISAYKDNITYDFIIVGGGTAGCVIANRLSENPNWNILLLEAGKRSTNPLMDVPALVPLTHFTPYNWGYLMEKQYNMGLGLVDQRIACPRGKGLGGSSLLDFMIHTRGNKKDYDMWEEMGNSGWNYENMLPYFIKSEKTTIPNLNPKYHGYGGPVNVESTPQKTEAGYAFIRAIKRLGYNYTDINGKNQKGVSFLQTTTRVGKRLSTDKAYLIPIANRTNLKVTENVHVTKILMSKTNKAYGVQFFKNGLFSEIKCRKEIIVSAGAINSPQLLMLSGIGPKENLEALGIKVRKDLPVGKKMIDRILFPGLTYTMNDNFKLDPYEIFNPAKYLQLFAGKPNILSSPAFLETISFLSLNVTAPEYPNVELLFSGSGLQTDFGTFTRRMLRINDDMYYKYWLPLEKKRTVQIHVIALHPKSSGKTTLKSNDPFESPNIYGNYFTDPERIDIKTYIEGIRFAQKIMATKDFKIFDARIVNASLPGCKDLIFDSDLYWECAVRNVGISIFHPMMTCKMGPSNDEEAVVNNNLKVHGVKNLRVADASIIPLPITGHPKVTVIVIGEKASDLIKEDWRMQENIH